jgi:DNA mismatch repair protein MutS2
LVATAGGLFDEEGSVRDEASPELSDIRVRLRRRRAQVTREWARLLERHRDALSDAVVVQRNDRYCLPVAASARARVPGIVHDRSGSGQTVFVEPIETIESNNELAMLAAEERREVERLVTAFGQNVLSRADELEAAVECLSELDALEAKVEFGELSDGHLAEISEDGEWALHGARHPLLDPRLAPLRQRVLGESREPRPIVPLDLDLPRSKRLLVISGPNAGGKTVVLKTAGLFSLLTQCGVPVPSGRGTRLPVFRAIQVEIGDAQAILSDRSTFSSSVETLARILNASQPQSLALVDEIGGATDPEEGSALAVAWLEEYLLRGGRAIVTTHLSTIKKFASERTDSVCAAMEFDEQSGRPNYRLHPGLSGHSRALSIAKDHGFPEHIIQRAEGILGETWKRRQQLETEAQETIERLRRSEKELEEDRRRFADERRRLAMEQEELSRERGRLREEGLARFEKARRELTRQVAQEVAMIRSNSAHRASESPDAIVREVEQTALAEAGVDLGSDPVSDETFPILPGARVRLRGRKVEGIVISWEGSSGWIDISGKRLQAGRGDLEAVAPSRPRRAAPDPAARAAGPSAAEPTREINVIGRHVDEAIATVEKGLDDALVAGAGRLRIVHGHGTGRLREGLREHFRKYPGVASLRPADAREGGDGATIVELE